MSAARRSPPRARRRGLAAALALAAACSPPEGVPAGASGEGPNVLLVLLDALAAGRVSHLGHERPTTPALDGLARDGATFTRAFAPAPYTLASVPSLFTGRLPDTHGLTRHTQVLPPEETCLAELLARRGYRTFGAVANLKGSSHHGLEQGFRTWVELFRAEDGRVRVPDADEFPPLVEGWLAEPGEGPFFFYLHVLEPHLPYDPPAEFRERFLDPAYTGRYAQGAKPDARGNVTEGWVPREHHDAVRALYDANLAWADHAVGRVLDLLRERGLYDDALIAVTSDHGEAHWQHGRWGHSTQLYDEMLHVPLVVKLPAARAVPGTRVDAVVSTLDLLPSLCEWLDLPAPPAPLDGVSVAGAALDPRRAPRGRELLLRTFHEVPVLALRRETEKVIVQRGPDGAPVAVERYDLAADPREKRDLGRAGAEGDVQALLDWSARATVLPPRSQEPTREETELLKALGYTE